MDPIIGAALIGAVGGGIQSAIGNEGRRNAEENARRYNLEQWIRQNQYNHPIQQMARLKMAGLNPNLIYGSSPGAATGNAGAVAPGRAADFKNPDVVGPAISAYSAASTQYLQRSNENLNNANAIKAISTSDLQNQQRKLLEETFQDDILKSKAARQKEEHLRDSARADAYIKDKTKAAKIDQESTKAANLILDGKIKQAQLTVLNLEKKWAQNGYSNKTPLFSTIFGNLGEKYAMNTSEGRWNVAKATVGIGLMLTPGGKLVKFTGQRIALPLIRRYAPKTYNYLTKIYNAFNKQQKLSL